MKSSELAVIAGVFSGGRMAPKKRFEDTLYVRLPGGTIDRLTALQGPLPQGEYVRALLLEAIEGRERAAARRDREETVEDDGSGTGDGE